MINITEFLDEIEVGDFVSLTYVYEQRKYTVEGAVIKLSERSVRIKKLDNTTSRIDLVDLEYYRSIPAPDMAGLSVVQTPKQFAEVKREVFYPEAVMKTTVEPSISVQASVPAIPIMVPHQLQMLQNSFLNAVAMDPEKIANLDEIRDRLKDTSYPMGLRNGIVSILSTFSNIRKQPNISLTELDDKMHNIIAKTLKLIQLVPEAAEDLYALLGGMNLLVRHYTESERYFLKASDYVGAAYAAHYGRNQAGLDAALDGYISAPETLDAYLYRLYASSASDRKDLRAMNDRKTDLAKKHAFEQREYQELEYLCACSLSIAQVNNLPVKWAMTYEQNRALNCLDQFLDSVPSDWKVGVRINTEGNSGLSGKDRIVSIIKAFAPKNIPYGHIARTGCEPNQGDTFFFIEQVNKEDCLREILNYKNQAKDLEVSFLLGEHRKDPTQPAAYDIRLTPRGTVEAERRLRSLTKPQTTASNRKSGNLMEFDTWDGYGRIWMDGEPFGIISREIVDPHLKGYLCLNAKSEYDIPVTFIAGKDSKGKSIALKIKLEDENYRLKDGEIQEAIRLARDYGIRLFEGDFSGWDSKKIQNQNGCTNLLAEEDYRNRPYVSLVPWKFSPQSTVTLRDTEIRKTADIPQVKEKTAEVFLPRLEPLPFTRSGRFLNLPSLTGYYYDRAHTCLLRRNLVEAENLYVKAIQANDKIESAILDLITLYLQDTNRVGDAIELLDSYGSYLPPDKRLNCEISVYSKWKERPYRIKLCHSIEKALKSPLKINTKLHYISMQAAALTAIEEYTMAMNSYKRWHQMYDTEVQYRGQSAVTQFSAARNFVRRGEAVCYYHTGDRLNAERLARELLKVSSADETAKQILEGTLVRSSEAIIISEEENKISDAEVSDFVQARMNALKLGEHLRSQWVVNGEYVGDARAAKADINFLLEAKGKTPVKRSELQMSIAKIITAFLNREGGKNNLKRFHEQQGLTEQKKKIHIARSMASYGDAILDDQQNLDTARFAYLQAMSVLPEHEEDWKKSFNHYLWSYFRGQQDMSQYIRDDLNVYNAKIDLSALSKRPLDTREFLVGLLRLREVLRGNTGQLRSQIAEQIRQSSMIDDVAVILEKCQIDADYSSADSFNRTLNTAVEELNRVHTELATLLKQLPEKIAARISGDNLRMLMSDVCFSDWLCKTDLERLNKVRQILEDFRQYFTFKEFQHRASTINTSIQRILKLSEEITVHPTKFSYEEILPVLEGTRTELQVILEQLYENFPPDMDITETDNTPPYLGKDNDVYVHLTISNGSIQSNGAERQLADNVTLEVETLSKGVLLLNTDLDDSGCVPGGKSIEAILTFRITDSQVLSMGMFDLSVRCKFRYNVRQGEPINKLITLDSQVVFNRDQKYPISNPYEKYVGNEMDEPKMFLGRENIIQELIRSMRVDGRFNYGHGVLLYGQTRSGKSSIRLHFIKRVREKEPEVIVVDMGNLYSSGLTMVSFYTRLLDKFTEEVEKNHPTFAQLLNDKGLQAPSEQVLFLKEHAQLLFDRYLDRVQDLVQKERKMILLVADEFSAINDSIKAGTMPSTFMQTWKAMLESYKLFSVCFGQDDTPEFVQMNQNAFARLVLKKVSYLEEGYAKQLMENPIRMHDGQTRYSPTALDELYELTAGSAYLIVKVCNLLVKYLDTKGAQRITPGILRNFLNNGVFEGNGCLSRYDFEPQIGDRANRELEKANERLLLDIARHSQTNGWAERDSLRESYNDAEGKSYPLRMLLNRLYNRDVIEQEDGSRYRIRVALLSRWLLSFYGKE